LVLGKNGWPAAHEVYSSALLCSSLLVWLGTVICSWNYISSSCCLPDVHRHKDTHTHTHPYTHTHPHTHTHTHTLKHTHTHSLQVHQVERLQQHPTAETV